MSEEESLMKREIILTDCRLLTKTNQKLAERDRLFKIIRADLTDLTRIKARINEAITKKKRSCTIMRVPCCPCLKAKEAQFYAETCCPDLGPGFRSTIQKKVRMNDEKNYAEYVEVRVDW